MPLQPIGIPNRAINVYLAASGRIILTTKKLKNHVYLGLTRKVTVNSPMTDTVVTATIEHEVEYIDIKHEGEEA